MDIQIREATKGDREDIWRVFNNVYLATYPHPGMGLRRSDVQSFLERTGKTHFQARMLGLGTNIWPVRYVVAVVDGLVVGYGVAGREGVEDLFETKEIKAINVVPSFQRLGVGAAILADLLIWLGDGEIRASVAVYTEPAIKFFGKHGFAFGTHVTDSRRLATIAGVTVSEIWMVRV